MTTVSTNGKIGLVSPERAFIRKSIDPTMYLSGRRKVDARVEIDFPFGTEVFIGDDILSMSLLEEANITEESPLGFVSSNELTLTLNNSSRRFTPKDLSEHIFYGDGSFMFDQNPATACSPVGDDYIWIDYGRRYTGSGYDLFKAVAFPVETIVIKSVHSAQITFEYFYISVGGYWWEYTQNIGPVTFEAFEAKEFQITPTVYSGGEAEPKLYSYITIGISKNWADFFEFPISEIELLDLNGTNQAVYPTADSYSSAVDEYYVEIYPMTYYIPPDAPLLVKPGLEIRPFVTISDDAGTTGEIPLGKFWCGEWDTPSNSLDAKTTAYDRLMNIITVDTPQIPAMINTTIGKMFARLFRALNIAQSDFIISPVLNHPVQVGWFPRDKVGQSLQLLAEAGNCYVTTNRYNQIVVNPNVKSGSSIKTYTESNSVYSVNNPQRFLDIYTAVKVIYRLPFIKDTNDQLVRVDHIFIPAGETVILDRIDFKDEDIPILQIDWVFIHGNYNLPETQDLFLGNATGGTFKLGKEQGLSTVWTTDIAYNASAEDLIAALEVIYGVGNVTVTGNNGRFKIIFTLNITHSNLVADFTGLIGAEAPTLVCTQEYVPPMKSKVVDISFGATDITLTVENSGLLDEHINIVVKGIGTGYHDSHRINKDETLIAEYGHKELTQENPLVQDRLLAETYSNLILQYVSDPLSKFEVDFRGDPLLEVGDIITVRDRANLVDATKIMPHRIVMDFGAKLSSSMTGRRAL